MSKLTYIFFIFICSCDTGPEVTVLSDRYDHDVIDAEYSAETAECEEKAVRRFPVLAINASNSEEWCCDPQNALEYGGAVTGLDYSPGEEFGIIAKTKTSGCVAVDFGEAIQSIAIVIRAARVPKACTYECGHSPSIGENLCGTDPGFLVFAAEAPEHMQFLAKLNISQELEEHIITYYSNVRIIVACRGVGAMKRDDIVIDFIGILSLECPGGV